MFDRSVRKLNNLNGPILVNGEEIDTPGYLDFHRRRIQRTTDKLSDIGARRVLELGSHPWVMTAFLASDGRFQLCGTVSAEEVTRWPDEIPVVRRVVRIRTASGGEHRFPNYSANLERTLFDLQETPDTVLACEIVEHLVRAPHLLFLNVNRWLPVGGKLLVTTPNGAQFHNPFRRRSPTAGYRCHVYERHHFLFTRDGLADLVRLCGFRINETGYWNVYPDHGLSRCYRPLARIPWTYFQDKFQKTLVLVAEKEESVSELRRLPEVYHPSDDWERIAADSPQDEVGP